MKKHTLSTWILAFFFQILLFTSGNTLAAKVVLDFEGMGDLKPVNDFYNNSRSHVPGTAPKNFGVRFSSTATSLVDLDAGGSGNFANEPSNNTALIFSSGGLPMMNVQSGFDTGFSLYYSYGLAETIHVFIFDELNGNGVLLSSMTLGATDNGNCKGDPFGDYCQWDAAGVKFSGIAKSVLFLGPAESVLFDDITLGSDHPGKTITPLPGAFWLMGPAVFGLLKIKRRSA